MTLLVSVVIPTYRRCESLRRLLQAFKRQTLAPEGYEVLVSIDGSEDGTREMLSNKYAEHMKKLSQPSYRIEMRDFYTGNASIRRDALLSVGGFDGDFKVYGHEDLELFMRLTNAGIPVKYSTQALAYQHFEKDFAAVVQDRIAAGQTAIQLVRKYPSARDAFLIHKYRQTSRRWRYTRWILLRMSRIWSGMPRLVVASVNQASRIWPVTFRFLAPVTLDYVFWASVFSEMRVEGWTKFPGE